MKTFLLAAASIAAMAFAPVAHAQSTDDDAPFNGAYIGVAGGYDVQPNDDGSRILFDRNGNGFNDQVTTATGANAFSPGFCNGRATSSAPTRCANDRDDWSYYARAGVDSQMGNLVVGFVGEFGKSEISDSVSAFSTTPASYTMTRSIAWEAGARARLGFAANTTLFYGTFGPGYARIDREFATSNTANAFTGSGKRNQWGYQAGGGIEQKLGRNFSIGLEYLYHDYNDDDYRVRATAGSAPATNPFILPPNTSGTDFARSDTDFRWHSMRATAAFRF